MNTHDTMSGRPGGYIFPGNAAQKPIDMVLFCPMCGTQHIDAPEPQNGTDHASCDLQCDCETGHCDAAPPAWTNPPHKSHLCHGCGTIWRPADVPTNGVAQIKTKGSADTFELERVVEYIKSHGKSRELGIAPPGWKLVPFPVTAEMVSAFMHYMVENPDGDATEAIVLACNAMVGAAPDYGD